MQKDNEISIPEILDLPGMEDVKAELEDPRFGGRAHGSNDSAKKCKGPLCKMAARQHMRNITMKAAMIQGREYRPYHSRMWDRDELLEAIITWHVLDIRLRKYEAKVARRSA